ncbi:unnamed protein product [Dibothriocephalus latus]|uniref:Uncharacterized protein n=1 Tax=Dibothriocephalus latus TaxID=60516 RepID=A0A3P6U3E8_DIBLA|nr:unnamed protein product [Dibothriocephalus latus]
MQVGPIFQLLLVAVATTTTAISRSHKFYLDSDAPWEARIRKPRSSDLEFDSEASTEPSGDAHEGRALYDLMRELHEAKMLQKAAEVEDLYAKILLGKAKSAFVTAATLQHKANELMGTPSTALLSDHTKKEKKRQGQKQGEDGGESEGEEYEKARDRLAFFSRNSHRTPFVRPLPRVVHAQTAEISPTARELYQLGLLSDYLNGRRGKVPQMGTYEEDEEDDDGEGEEEQEELGPPAYLAGPFRRRGIPEQDDLQEFLARFHKHAQAARDKELIHREFSIMNFIKACNNLKIIFELTRNGKFADL